MHIYRMPSPGWRVFSPLFLSSLRTACPSTYCIQHGQKQDQLNGFSKQKLIKHYLNHTYYPDGWLTIYFWTITDSNWSLKINDWWLDKELMQWLLSVTSFPLQQLLLVFWLSPNSGLMRLSNLHLLTSNQNEKEIQNKFRRSNIKSTTNLNVGNGTGFRALFEANNNHWTTRSLLITCHTTVF